MAEKVFVFGASGHAKVVIDTLAAAGEYEIALLADDDASKSGQPFFGYRIAGGREALLAQRGRIAAGIVAIGANHARAAVAQWLACSGFRFIVARHPLAVVAGGVVIGEGALIAAGCILQPDTRIGAHAIVNTGASVDHDCEIGRFAHIAPGCRVCGGVRIGEGSLLGAGTVVIPGVTIGAGVTVGAGATVTADLPDGVRAAGTPCRVIGN